MSANIKIGIVKFSPDFNNNRVLTQFGTINCICLYIGHLCEFFKVYSAYKDNLLKGFNIHRQIMVKIN